MNFVVTVHSGTKTLKGVNQLILQTLNLM